MIYFFDGTKEGFFTAFLAAYSDENALLTSKNAQLTLGQEAHFIPTDSKRAQRAIARFSQLDAESLQETELLLRSGDEGAETVAFRYLRLLAEKGRPVRGMLSDNRVLSATEYIRRVSHEIHRMHGFLRFMESASGALYAPVSPDHDICDLLVPHFRARLPAYPFVIHDVGRKKAAIYDGENCFLAPLERAEVVLSANESEWQALFRRYHSAVNIPERKRLKQMRGYLPVRYWKFMPEKRTPTDD